MHPDVVLDGEMLGWIRRLVRGYGGGLGAGKGDGVGVGVLIGYLRLVFSVFLGLEPGETGFICEVLTQEFVRFLFGLFIRYRNCNIVHNLVKDIIIHGINKKYGVIVPILLNPATGLLLIAS